MADEHDTTPAGAEGGEDEDLDDEALDGVAGGTTLAMKKFKSPFDDDAPTSNPANPG